MSSKFVRVLAVLFLAPFVLALGSAALMLLLAFFGGMARSH